MQLRVHSAIYLIRHAAQARALDEVGERCEAVGPVMQLRVGVRCMQDCDATAGRGTLYAGLSL